MFRLLSFFFTITPILFVITVLQVFGFTGVLGTSPDGFVQGDNHKAGITHLK